MKTCSKKTVIAVFTAVSIILLLIGFFGIVFVIYYGDYIELPDPQGNSTQQILNLFALGVNSIIFVFAVLLVFVVILVLSAVTSVILRLVYRKRYCAEYARVYKVSSIVLWSLSGTIYLLAVIFTKFQIPITALVIIILIPLMEQVIFLLGFRNNNRKYEMQMISMQQQYNYFNNQERNFSNEIQM